MGGALSGWEVALLVSKLGVIGGLLAAAGGILALQHYHDGSRAGHVRLLAYSLFGSVLGLHASVAQVLLQAGQINASGVMGMFDLDLIGLLRGTPVWEAAAFRGVGFLLSALLVLTLLRVLRLQKAAPPAGYYRIANVGQAAALGLVAFGFTQLGHVSATTPLAQLALFAHVAAMGAWIGMLLPLRWCCARVAPPQLTEQMRRFGRLGLGLVAVLLASGAVLVLSLVPLGELLTTAYGRLLLVKMALFAGLILIAGMNRLRYVPALKDSSACGADSRLRLRGSIDREIALAGALLLLTATLSTLLGPGGHAGMP